MKIKTIALAGNAPTTQNQGTGRAEINKGSSIPSSKDASTQGANTRI
jgi:hypothetical protein